MPIIPPITSSPEDRILFIDKNFSNSLVIGRGTYINGFEDQYASGELKSILVGRFCSIGAEMVLIMGANHPLSNISTFPFYHIPIIKNIFGSVKPIFFKNPNHYQVIIGHDVWLGRGVTIMDGVKIGNGAVIGAGAVVAKDIPPYAIAVGNPVRIIKYRFDESTIKKLLAIKWWNWSLKKIAANMPLMTDIEKFVNTHYSSELENFPEDDLSRVLDNSINGGGYVYQFISDFRAARPLWIKIVREFCQSDFEKNLLIIYLGRDATNEDFKALAAEINRFDNGARNNILIVNAGEKIFSPAALRKGTHFITTREMVTLEALDYLWNTDVKIISGLDDKIFGG